MILLNLRFPSPAVSGLGLLLWYWGPNQKTNKPGLTVQTVGRRRRLAAPKQVGRHGDHLPRQLPRRVGHRSGSRKDPPPGEQPHTQM